MDIENKIEGLPDTEAFRILAGSSISMVLTDPSLQDNPIVYVNPAFERVTGYAASAAVGRNCRFLQGKSTDPDDVERIRKAIREEQETTVDIENVRADGTAFLNRLLLTPIYDVDGSLRFFLGIQKALSDHEARNSVNVNLRAMRELKHRVKNHLAMIVSMVRLQARDKDTGPESVRTLARRVESLQLLYEEMSGYEGDSGAGTVALGTYISRLANTTAHLDGRPGIRVNLDISDARCEAELAAKIGLILSEVMNNALQHAFVGRDEGLLDVRLDDLDRDKVLIRIADNGIGMADTSRWPDPESVGGRVVLGLVNDLEADLDVDSGPGGTTVNLTVPTRH
ncbi:PAS domain-containing protein [Sulfitobacter sp. D35]|uniref:PAS domain-containing protein n=1 Tax=Sulfitobacter sp. D35 TaxID=3083252 RepID=UPI00296FBE6B|nr:PAS domain-containing protein [Sulfitobacter sp. D35]MDW4499478.1 PAS domain-containing protein [Sulfitobacter sp. D35]